MGCSAALGLLLALDWPGARRVVVSGDNLAVVRFCAGLGRLRSAAMWSRLDGLVGAAMGQGWALTWRAVRRRLNAEADVLATCGVLWAGSLRRDGVLHDVDLTW